MNSEKIALAEPKTRYSFKMISKELINHDVIRFVFELPSKDHILGTKSGQHFFIVANINNQEVYRKYTPVSLENQKGSFDVIIKVYRDAPPKSPNGGIMTKHLEGLNVGDCVFFEGRFGRCTYKHNGIFELRHDKISPMITKTIKNLGLIAGGSGITPLYQIAKTICEDSNDQTKTSLILANHTDNDIILRDELDSMALKHKEKFSVWYTISQSVKENWTFSFGHVDEEQILKYLPHPSQDTLIMYCGPKPMNQHVKQLLEKSGYSKDMIFKY